MSGREEGIRTLDTLFTYTRFPGVRLKPLIHLSVESAIIADDETADKDGMLFCKKSAKNNNKYNSVKVNYCENLNFKNNE